MSEQEEETINSVDGLNLILKDPLLQDVSPHPTLMDVEVLIAVEAGHAWFIDVIRSDDSVIRVATLKNSSLGQFKKQIQRTIEKELRETKSEQININWKHIWQKHCLLFENRKLLEDNQVPIVSCGLYDGCRVKLIPYLNTKRKSKKQSGKN